MSATVLPIDATDKSVTWSIDPPAGVATIDSDGLLTAVDNGTVKVIATANDGSDVFGELDITINIPPVTVTVTFNADGGDPTPVSQTIPKGTMATEPTATTKAGHTFDGWFTDADALWNFADVVNDDMTLTAKWATIPIDIPITVIGIEIAADPIKMVYEEGEILDLSGLSVTIYYSDGSDETMALADFAANDLAVTPADGTVLTVADHDDIPIVVTHLESSETAETSNLTVEVDLNNNFPPIVLINGEPLELASAKTRYNVECDVENVTVSTIVNGNTVSYYESSLSSGDNIIEPISGYTLIINKPYNFDDMVIVRWQNTMTVRASFSGRSYQWFANGSPLASGDRYSVPDAGYLSPDISYSVIVSNSQGEVISRSCPSVGLSLSSLKVEAYPNPVAIGQTLYINADVSEELLQGAIIEVYNISGNRMDYIQVQGHLTPLNTNYTSGAYIFRFKGNNGFTKELTIIVE